MLFQVLLAKGLMKVEKMGRFSLSLMGFVVLLCLWAAAVAEAGGYVKYKDPKQPIGARIKDLMSRMTVEEKIGQMTQIERKLASPDIMNKYFIGKLSILCFIQVYEFLAQMPHILFLNFFVKNRSLYVETTCRFSGRESE